MKSAELRRLFELSKQELLLKLVELKELLENRNNAPMVHEWEGSIEVEEWADENGHIVKCAESVWMQSIADRTKLDVRAILSPLPQQLGLYTLDCLTISNKGKVIVWAIKLWVVPIKVEE